MNFQLDFSLIAACYFSLILFGIGYNLLVSQLEKKGYLEGFVSLVVALGVGITLTVLAIISWQFALIALGGFIASGSPMIAGSILRYVRSRKAEQEDTRMKGWTNVG
jgi:hypothetical protein